jgi:hypothetical protein
MLRPGLFGEANKFSRGAVALILTRKVDGMADETVIEIFHEYH